MIRNKYRPVGARVPELAIDAQLYTGGRCVSPNGRLERRIVANLIAHLKKHNFRPVSVHDGDEETRATDTKAVMELVFNLDDCWVYFARKGYANPRSMRLVLGNGDCILSDWRYDLDDTDGFNAALEAFNTDDWA